MCVCVREHCTRVRSGHHRYFNCIVLPHQYVQLSTQRGRSLDVVFRSSTSSQISFFFFFASTPYSRYAHIIVYADVLVFKAQSLPKRKEKKKKDFRLAISSFSIFVSLQNNVCRKIERLRKQGIGVSLLRCFVCLFFHIKVGSRSLCMQWGTITNEFGVFFSWAKKEIKKHKFYTAWLPPFATIQ